MASVSATTARANLCRPIDQVNDEAEPMRAARAVTAVQPPDFGGVVADACGADGGVLRMAVGVAMLSCST